jgi:hypothetical protein
VRLFTVACRRLFWPELAGEEVESEETLAEQREAIAAQGLRAAKEDATAARYAASSLARNSPPAEGVGLLRDILGNPFRPSPPLLPAVLAWNDRTISRLAQAIYDERKLPEGTLDNSRLAILADALLDAGCDDEALIQHCRSEGPHVRGCWAVDLILAKS